MPSQSTDGVRTALMAIPFKSLRFPPGGAVWRLAAWRWIARRSEGSWWPRETLEIRGILSQAAPVVAIQGIAGSWNVQFVPSMSWRAFRAVDKRSPTQPTVVSDLADANAGLDSKLVIKDSLVVDATVNPDFSQVESDEPQSVVNQRFEVFFPERRLFFTENANFFELPLVGANERFLFTRRIADPRIGARVTGKIRDYSIGALVADDRAPGESAAQPDSPTGARASVSAVRSSRDLGGQSNVGAMMTERRPSGASSRLVSADSVVRFNTNWSGTLIAAKSWNGFPGSVSEGRVEDIDWIEAAGNYVTLHVGSCTHLVRVSMSTLETRLSIDQFARVHRSTIVNLDRIKVVEPWFRGEQMPGCTMARRCRSARHSDRD